MENLAPDQIGFMLHPVLGADRLDAFVFSRKFAQLLAALAAADKAVNGKRGNVYSVARLHSSAPTAVLVEAPAKPQYNLEPPRSGIVAFDRCATAIVEGDISAAQAFGECANKILKLSSGTAGYGRKFGYGAVWSGRGSVIRIDDFLERRAVEAARGELPPPEGGNAPPPRPKWFRGVIDGSFEGTLQAVDIRGTIPECSLVVGPGHQIDCVFQESELKTVAGALASKSRTRISGRAIYDGNSGLPARIEIREIEQIDKEGVDFFRWRGAFEPFLPEEWEDDAL
jgi:hypothetical protein